MVAVSLAGDEEESVGSVGSWCSAGRPARAETPDTAFGFCRYEATGLTLTGVVEPPGVSPISPLP